MLNSNFITGKFVYAEVNFTKASLPKFSLKLESINSHAEVEVFAHGEDNRFFSAQILHILVHHFDSFHGEKSNTLLQLLVLVILVLEFFKESLLDLPDVIVDRTSLHYARRPRSTILEELDLNLL